VDRLDAVVVGAGPNGLAAAVALAEQGASVVVLEAADTVGGGTRSAELTLPGLVHDVCSAVHPTGAASPVFRRWPLEDHGLVWRHPPVAVAHPFEDRPAALLHADLDRTVAGLGPDGHVWRRWFGPLVERWDDLAEDLLSPLARLPRHPLTFLRGGLASAPPATWRARAFSSVEGRALVAGIAAHTVLPLERPLTSAIVTVLGTAGHVGGWPVAEGGSQAIADALVSYLRELGGEVRTGHRVGRLEDLPPTRVALLDVTPSQLVAIAGDRLPAIARARALRFRHGPAAFKLDLAVEGGVPWRDPAVRGAGTVHVGGPLEQVAAAERAPWQGRASSRPYVLLAQQHVADPTRSVGDVHPVWLYGHVPNGWAGDQTDVLLDEVERHAPGLRERIVGMHVTPPAALWAHDENYVGGDISGGAADGLQLLGRPRFALDPYSTGVPGLFLCSSSTPPGAGVHGLPGWWAAQSALRALA
jgi:phytoene dehydrogenase-like protein